MKGIGYTFSKQFYFEYMIKERWKEYKKYFQMLELEREKMRHIIRSIPKRLKLKYHIWRHFRAHNIH